jgi:zeaxanthin glucosyltransferase
MKVLFHMLPEPGHMNPSFSLAQALRVGGHEVTYGSTLDFEQEVTRRGFGFVPFHRDVYPRGWAVEFGRLPVGETRASAARLSQAWRAENFLSGRVEEWVRQANPDLILSDVLNYHMTLVAHRLQVPCMRLSTSLSQRLDELPPLTSSLPLDTPPLQLEAARHRAAMSSSSAEAGWTADIYCARFGYPARQASYASVFCPDLTLYREGLLCASAFDFPRQHGEPPLYLAVPVELDRAESVPPSLPTFLDPERPLIYVSLGSQASGLPRGTAILRAVVSAMEARPRWQAVIAGGGIGSSELWRDAPPPNVTLLAHAPQLWLLRRAAVFVTHAGLGSVREAIALEVPMLAIPHAHDGFGNAARIAYHGIGVHLPAPAADATSIAGCLDALLSAAPSYGARLAQLNAQCREEERENRGPQLIEALAGRRRPHAPGEAAASVDVQEREGWLFVDAETRAFRSVALRPGSTHCDDRALATLGSSGFWIRRRVGEALACAEGSVLARVELASPAVEQDGYLVAQALSCHWLVDVAPVLRQYARWCAEQSLQTEPSLAVTAIEWCQGVLASWPDPSTSAGTSVDATARWNAMATEVRAVCERAGLILSDATLSSAWDAARFSRWRAVRTLALRAVADAAGTPAGAEAYVHAQRNAEQRFDAQLEGMLLAWFDEQSAVERLAPGLPEHARTALSGPCHRVPARREHPCNES